MTNMHTPPTLGFDKNNMIPHDLDGYQVAKSLGGGTQSTFLLTHPDKQSLVLKFGAHLDAMKMEIFTNALYQLFNVNIPAFEVFTSLPINLT